MIMPGLLIAEMQSPWTIASAYQCRHCRGGPVQMLGGDFGTKCLNCSSHRVTQPLFDLPVREIFKTVGGWFKHFGRVRKEWLQARRAKDALCFSTDGIFS